MLKKLLERFNKEKKFQKTNQTNFRVEKLKKKKGNKLYAKRKGYNNPFNSCIDKKDIVKKWDIF